ncbi:hypothetical protein SUGI_0595220 [Cryptomeria japonica]|uniref:uncharacterized protein LOC131053743 n=1 Tax=Cryptomeria japonica TaxID=3369 RepID=UPI002414BC9B|nr:uncharacterized protein LOC131053743 [Cryptomeria japonica]GLJ30097.1 hypothetical protein SUGI_0595220 [Cryptomeria japonica]
MADPSEGFETKERIRRPDTTFLWSGQLNAEVAAKEASALSPDTIEATCKTPTDWEPVDDIKQHKGKNERKKEKNEKVPKNDEDVDQSTKVGCVEKLKDLITGPKPREENETDSSVTYIQRGIHRGPVASPSLGAPALAGLPVGTYDVHRHVENKLVARPKTESSVHGGFGSGQNPSGSPKKEGVVSKVMHKLHLGA